MLKETHIVRIDNSSLESAIGKLWGMSREYQALNGHYTKVRWILRLKLRRGTIDEIRNLFIPKVTERHKVQFTGVTSNMILVILQWEYQYCNLEAQSGYL